MDDINATFRVKNICHFYMSRNLLITFPLFGKRGDFEVILWLLLPKTTLAYFFKII